jgi:DNA mismatch endonuclease (patch repair protein)
LARNTQRDQENNTALRGAGWTVLRYWEHESPEDVASRVADILVQLAAVRPGDRKAGR